MATARHPVHDHIDDTLHTTVFAFWLSQRGGRDMPRMNELELDMIASLLPDIGMIHTSPRARMVRHGSVPARCAAFYPEGLLPAAAPQMRQLRAVCATARRARAPVYSETALRLAGGGHVWVTRLVLPLAGAGGAVEGLLYSVRIVPRPGGDAENAEREQAVADAIEVKRVVFERFEVQWTSREFRFRCLRSADDDWMADGDRSAMSMRTGPRPTPRGRYRTAGPARRGTDAAPPVWLPGRWRRN